MLMQQRSAMIRDSTAVHNDLQEAERTNAGADFQHSYIPTRRSCYIRRTRVRLWRSWEHQISGRRARFQATV